MIKFDFLDEMIDSFERDVSKFREENIRKRKEEEERNRAAREAREYLIENPAKLDFPLIISSLYLAISPKGGLKYHVETATFYGHIYVPCHPYVGRYGKICKEKLFYTSLHNHFWQVWSDLIEQIEEAGLEVPDLNKLK